MQLVFDIRTGETVTILLKDRSRIIAAESLTIGQDFDNMLIKALDKLLASNKIDRLSIKSVKIAGKIKPTAISAMILQTVKSALVA